VSRTWTTDRPGSRRARSSKETRTTFSDSDVHSSRASRTPVPALVGRCRTYNHSSNFTDFGTSRPWWAGMWKECNSRWIFPPTTVLRSISIIRSFVTMFWNAQTAAFLKNNTCRHHPHPSRLLRYESTDVLDAVLKSKTQSQVMKSQSPRA